MAFDGEDDPGYYFGYHGKSAHKFTKIAPVDQGPIDPADFAPIPDAVNPAHYRSSPSGVQCITVTEHMNFCLGNAVKYIWRADSKGNAIEDLKKAAWYIDREISRRQAQQ